MEMMLVFTMPTDGPKDMANSAHNIYIYIYIYRRTQFSPYYIYIYIYIHTKFSPYYVYVYIYIYTKCMGASWTSGSMLDHRSLPPMFESRCEHTWRLFHLWLRFITFGGHLDPLAYHLHKSGCNVCPGSVPTWSGSSKLPCDSKGQRW